MYKVQKINSKNVKTIEYIYNDFLRNSFKDYGFEIMPLELKDTIEFVDKGILNILALYENQDKFAKGILIYAPQEDLIELSIIHCPGKEDIENKKTKLMEVFMDEAKNKNYKLISYAMLGVQADYVRKIAHFGFEFVGQSIVKFKFNNEKSLKIFEKVIKLPKPKNIEILDWDEKYEEEVIEIIKSSFDKMQDSKFDPRFKTKEGCTDILNKITKNIYGEFLPKYTKIIAENNRPKGFCMVNLTTPLIANIPLIGLKDELKGKGLGKLLFQEVLTDIIADVKNEKLKILEINATSDTNNHAAIRMYRYFGFKEDVHYPQAYCKLN